jgi:hypothetical protein
MWIVAVIVVATILHRRVAARSFDAGENDRVLRCETV